MWEISGVLNWDDLVSVPQVIARTQVSWLWMDDSTRTQDATENRDVPATRELTMDELLIKAYFDQVMSRLSPSYIEDAYGRGIWLRKLFHFLFAGFHDAQE